MKQFSCHYFGLKGNVQVVLVLLVVFRPKELAFIRKLCPSRPNEARYFVVVVIQGSCQELHEKRVLVTDGIWSKIHTYVLQCLVNAELQCYSVLRVLCLSIQKNRLDCARVIEILIGEMYQSICQKKWPLSTKFAQVDQIKLATLLSWSFRGAVRNCMRKGCWLRMEFGVRYIPSHRVLHTWRSLFVENFEIGN